jgi:hypothetical protein
LFGLVLELELEAATLQYFPSFNHWEMASAPATTAAASGSGAAPQQQQPPDKLTSFLQMINYIIFFFLFQSIVGSMVQKIMGPPQPQSQFNGVGSVSKSNPAQQQQRHQQTRPYRDFGKPFCLWEQGTVMDLDVIISDSSIAPNGWSLTTPSPDEIKIDYSNDAEVSNKANPRRTKVTLNKQENNILASWRQENLILGGTNDPLSKPSLFSFFGSTSNQEMNHRNSTLTIPLTQALWNNETQLYAYVKLMRRRYGNEVKERREDVLVKRVELTRYRKRKRKRDGVFM